MIFSLFRLIWFVLFRRFFGRVYKVWWRLQAKGREEKKTGIRNPDDVQIPALCFETIQLVGNSFADNRNSLHFTKARWSTSLFFSWINWTLRKSLLGILILLVKSYTSPPIVMNIKLTSVSQRTYTKNELKLWELKFYHHRQYLRY